MARPLAIAFSCVLSLLSGCGTILTSGTHAVPIDSQPSGAAVLLEGRLVGITPCAVPIRVTDRQVTLVLDGFHRQLVDVGSQRSLWTVGNVATLGLGLLVDVALGFDRVPDTAPVVVHLRSNEAPPPTTWTRPRAAAAEPSPPMGGGDNLVAALLRALVDHHNR